MTRKKSEKTIQQVRRDELAAEGYHLSEIRNFASRGRNMPIMIMRKGIDTVAINYRGGIILNAESYLGM